MINNKSIGHIAIIEPAISCGKFVEYWPCSDARPDDNGILSIETFTIKGHIRSFQANNAVNIPRAINPDSS